MSSWRRPSHREKNRWGHATYTDDFLIDLSGTHAFAVRILAGGHFQHTHAKSVDVDSFVVMLLVHFGCHEFWCANHRFGKRTVLERGQTQVANFHAARRPSDEDVVALSHLKEDVIYRPMTNRFLTRF